jgi:serine/threonine protein kinase
MLGETIERYRVEECLGEGAVAAVYRVKHDSLGSTHALKVLRVSNVRAREALLHEGRGQARVHHPNLVAVTDILVTDDRPALVLEYVDGPSLDKWLEQGKPSLEEALAVFHGIVRGVEAAHTAGLVHRDLKPANVLLARTPEGLVPKVADFGLVRDLSRPDPDEGSSFGSAGYTAPEALQGLPDIDERADLFALGCLLYELVTGQPAFPDEGDLVETAQRTLSGQYVPAEQVVPGLPEEVLTTLRGLLEVDRDKRLRSCAELLDLLYGTEHSLLSQEICTDLLNIPPPLPTTPAPGPVPQRASARWGISPSNPWIAVAFVLLGLYGATAWLLVGLLLYTGQSDAPAAEPIEAREPLAQPSPPTPASVAEAAFSGLTLASSRPPPKAPRPPVKGPQEPLPEAGPAPARGVLQVEGDGRVELTGPDGQPGAPGEVVAGRWRYQVYFGSNPGPSGSLEVRPGRKVALRCSSFAMRCRIMTR